MGIQKIAPTENIAEVGYLIEWTFPDNQDVCGFLAGNSFRAYVCMVNTNDSEYAVMAEYGQDYIGFDQATIIKKAK